MNSKVSTFKSFLAYNAILQGEKQLRQTMKPLLLRTHSACSRYESGSSGSEHFPGWGRVNKKNKTN